MKRIAALLMLIPVPAMAQDAIVPISGTSFQTILYGALATVLTTCVIPYVYYTARQKIAERKLALAQLEEQLRGTLDSGAQKAIGGELGKIAIPEGKLTGMAKNAVVTNAAEALAKNFPATFAALGVEDVSAKSKEIIESRIGLMDAQAAGNPVPNPSQAPAVSVPGATPELAPVKKK